MSGLIKKVDTSVAACFDRDNDYGRQPGEPDEPFYDIPSGHLFVPGHEDGLLAAGCGTDPPAKGATAKQRAYKHEGKHDEAAADDPFGTGDNA